MPLPSIISARWVADSLNGTLNDNDNIVSIPNAVSGQTALTIQSNTVKLKKNIVNGKSVFRMSGNGAKMSAGDNYDLGTDGLTFFIVAKIRNSDICFFQKRTSGGDLVNDYYAISTITYNSFGDAYKESTGTKSGSIASPRSVDSSFVLYEFRLQRNYIATYVDKGLIAQTTFTDNSAQNLNNALDLIFGYFDSGLALPADADFADIIIVKQSGDISSTDRNAIYDTLGADYALSYYTPSVGYTLAVSNASVTAAGQTVNFSRTYNLAIGVASIAVSAQSVGLNKTGNYSLSVTAASLLLSGQAVNLIFGSLPIKPSDVSDVEAIAYSNSQIKVTWEKTGTGTTYLIQIAPNSDFSGMSQFQSNKDYIVFDAIPVNEFFYIRVKARNLDGVESENWSETAIVRITSGVNLGDYFEELKLSEIFNITQLDLEMPVLTADFGDGYGAGALSGKASGLRYWSISAELLPDLEEYSLNYSTEDGAQTDTRFQYFWEFCRRHLALGNKPFYFRDPRTDKIFLASFVEKRISFESITSKLYRGGVQIKQRRARIEGIVYSARDGAIEY